MKNPLSTNKVAAYYWRRASRYPRWVLGTLIAVPFTTLINSYLPALIAASVLSSLSQHHFNDIWHSYGPELIAYSILSISGIAAWRLVDYFMWRLEANVTRDISEEVFSHLMEESADFHANNFSGSLVSQTNKLTGGYIRTADTTIFQVLPLISGLIIATVILSIKAPLFVILLDVFALLFLTVAIKVSRQVQRRGHEFAAAESKQTGGLADAITNVMAVKGFGHINFERQRFRRATTNTYDHLFMFARAMTRQLNVLGFLNRAILSLAFVMGGC